MTFTIAPNPPALLVIAPMFSAISFGVSGELGDTPPTSVAIDCGLVVPFGKKVLPEVEGDGFSVGAAFETDALIAPKAILRTNTPIKRTLFLVIISPSKWLLHFEESTYEVFS